MDKQKSWQTPQLIVLAQGRPDESVLTKCKVQNPNVAPDFIPGPDGTFVQYCTTDIEGRCGNCKSRDSGT